MGAFLGCGGLDDLHGRAAKDPGKNTISDQIIGMVETEGFALLSDKSFKLVDPPAAFGLSSDAPYDTYARWSYSIAAKLYAKLKCGAEPPLPKQGTFEDRLLFWALYTASAEMVGQQELGAMDFPPYLSLDDYVVGGMPFVTNEKAEELIQQLSIPLPEVAQNNPSSQFDAFDARATTQLERALLTAWGKIAGYNAGFPGAVPEQFIQRYLGDVTQLGDAADGAVHLMFWMRTGKVAPPRAVALLSPLAAILVYRRGWAKSPDQINVTPQLQRISPDIIYNPPIYFVRTSDRQAQSAIFGMVRALTSRGAYGDDVESIAAAALMLSTDPSWDVPEVPELLVDGMIQRGHTPTDDWTYVPELGAILNSSPMTPERQQAIKALEIEQPVMWRLWSEVNDMIIERQGEIAFGN